MSMSNKNDFAFTNKFVTFTEEADGTRKPHCALSAEKHIDVTADGKIDQNGVAPGEVCPIMVALYAAHKNALLTAKVNTVPEQTEVIEKPTLRERILDGAKDKTGQKYPMVDSFAYPLAGLDDIDWAAIVEEARDEVICPGYTNCEYYMGCFAMMMFNERTSRGRTDIFHDLSLMYYGEDPSLPPEEEADDDEE